MTTNSISTHAAENFPPVAELPANAALPDPLVMLDGHRVKTKEEWFAKRRPELKELFQHYMYGYAPPAPEKIETEIEARRSRITLAARRPKKR